MIRRHYLSLALCAATAAISLLSIDAVAQSQQRVIGSGKPASVTREVGAFQAIEMKGPVDAVITVGGPAGLTVEGDDNLLALVVTEVNGNTLLVDLREQVEPKSKLRVRIGTAKLEDLRMRGSGDAQVSGLAGGPFNVTLLGSGDLTAAGRTGAVSLETRGSGNMRMKGLSVADARIAISGSGDVEVGKIEGAALTASIRGSGNIRASGRADKVDITVDGSGDVDLAALTSVDATVILRGSGNVSLICNHTLKIAQRGSGDVRHTGSAQVTREALRK